MNPSVWPFRPSPAAVLRLIRDGRANTQAELETALGLDTLSLTVRGMAQRNLRDVVGDLVRATLVIREGEKLLASEALGPIQSALGISLEELLRRDEGAILVEPFFGSPHRSKRPIGVFVVMPFRQDLRAVYDGPITAAAASLGLTATRGDDFFSGKVVMAEVWSAIFYCKAVVADCTGRNPNVFYEVGLAHTLGRPVILLSQAIEDIPFDLRHVRMIVYDPTAEGMVKLAGTLARALGDTVESAQHTGSNPMSVPESEDDRDVFRREVK